MIETLSTPIESEPDGLGRVVTLTHRAWEMRHSPTRRDEKLLSTYVLGIMRDGEFVPLSSTARSLAIPDSEYAALCAATPQGKKAGVFRVDDVITAHKKLSNLPK